MRSDSDPSAYHGRPVSPQPVMASVRGAIQNSGQSTDSPLPTTGGRLSIEEQYKSPTGSELKNQGSATSAHTEKRSDGTSLVGPIQEFAQHKVWTPPEDCSFIRSHTGNVHNSQMDSPPAKEEGFEDPIPSDKTPSAMFTPPSFPHDGGDPLERDSSNDDEDEDEEHKNWGSPPDTESESSDSLRELEVEPSTQNTKRQSTEYTHPTESPQYMKTPPRVDPPRADMPPVPTSSDGNSAAKTPPSSPKIRSDSHQMSFKPDVIPVQPLDLAATSEHVCNLIFNLFQFNRNTKNELKYRKVLQLQRTGKEAKRLVEEALALYIWV